MSIKAEVLCALDASQQPLTARQILELVSDRATVASVMTILSGLKSQGVVEDAGKSAPAEGERSATLWRATPNGHAIVAGTVGTAPARGARKRRARAARPAKAKRTRKLHRRSAVSRRTRRAAAPAPTPRWALTSDGALLLLGADIEISKSQAQALVVFVRTLDGQKA